MKKRPYTLNVKVAFDEKGKPYASESSIIGENGEVMNMLDYPSIDTLLLAYLYWCKK